MLKLFHSVFGREAENKSYPESLVDAAVERAVDGTDSRLKLVSRYNKNLRPSVIHAIDHVSSLVDGIHPPLVAGRADYSSDPRLVALFASADHMLEVFGKGDALNEFRDCSNGSNERVTVLLLAQHTEKSVLGMDLVGDMVQKDVAQIVVNFSAHRLLEPAANELDTRRQLKRRAFDHLLTLALARMTEAGIQRADLSRQRDLLRRKLGTLERSGWSFELQEDARPEPDALSAELQAIESELANMGADTGVLQARMDTLVDVLGHAEQQLWARDLVTHLDRKNIQRDAQDVSARRIVLQELQNARGQHLVMLMLSLVPGELPEREDFSTLAARYLA